MPLMLKTPCNCLAVRQAARHVTQFYDRCLAPSGLRTTQFSILSKLDRLGPSTINALAGELVMDRTTLGRTILPLQRDGLVAAASAPSDRRNKEVHLTKAGARRLATAHKLWEGAQASFEATFGSERASSLRKELDGLVASEFGLAPRGGARKRVGPARGKPAW